jgi:hypothetical protein
VGGYEIDNAWRCPKASSYRWRLIGLQPKRGAPAIHGVIFCLASKQVCLDEPLALVALPNPDWNDLFDWDEGGGDNLGSIRLNKKQMGSASPLLTSDLLFYGFNPPFSLGDPRHKLGCRVGTFALTLSPGSTPTEAHRKSNPGSIGSDRKYSLLLGLNGALPLVVYFRETSSLQERFYKAPCDLFSAVTRRSSERSFWPRRISSHVRGSYRRNANCCLSGLKYIASISICCNYPSIRGGERLQLTARLRGL